MSARENGAVSDVDRDLVGGAADLLVERLAQIDERLADLEPLRDERKRLVAALGAIAPEHPRIAPATPAAPARRPGKERQRWNVSERKRGQALEALRALGEPVSTAVVAQRAGMARETARKALEVMRDDEIVRVAGTKQVAGHPVKLYAPMPEAGDRGA